MLTSCDNSYEAATTPLITYPPPIYSPTRPHDMSESYMPSIRYGSRKPPSIAIHTSYHADFALLPQGHQHRIIYATNQIYEQACLTTGSQIGWIIRLIGHEGRDFKVLVHWYNRETGLFEVERFLWVDMWLVHNGWKIVVKDWTQAIRKRIAGWVFSFL